MVPDEHICIRKHLLIEHLSKSILDIIAKPDMPEAPSKPSRLLSKN